MDTWIQDFDERVAILIKENVLERRLKQKVERSGGMALKFITPSMVGVPDRIVLIPGGKIFFVELKAPGQRLRPLQDKRKRQLEALGFTVRCIDSLSAIEAFVKEAF